MRQSDRPVHVSVLAIPEAVLSAVTGIFDVLSSFPILQGFHESIPVRPPFVVEIVGELSGDLTLASGVPVRVHRSVRDIPRTDVIIAPPILLVNNDWGVGRYPELTKWVVDRHAEGALVCSACSGVFLLAETGLYDGQNATVHWIYRDAFARRFPQVPVDPQKVLVVSGQKQEFISSGASMIWHDLVLYLIARFVNSPAAQAVARFFALQLHADGVAPFIVFEGRTDHGDAIILDVQEWVATKYSVARPVDEMIRRTGLPERTFKRRFKAATGFAPLDYVQRLRVEHAKRMLEAESLPVDEIAWRVGYEDPAFFRRLFRRITNLPPGAYRRRFRIPEFADVAANTESGGTQR